MGHISFSKVFYKWLFLWWKKGFKMESYLLKKKKKDFLATTVHLTAIAKAQFCVFSK